MPSQTTNVLQLTQKTGHHLTSLPLLNKYLTPGDENRCNTVDGSSWFVCTAVQSHKHNLARNKSKLFTEIEREQRVSVENHDVTSLIFLPKCVMCDV